MKKILFLFFILFISPVFGVVYDTNITGACGVYENLNAKFSPIQYTCSSGYFLPANAISCAACPSGFSCPGGTYTFNKTKNSGLISSGTITQNITNACDVNFTTLKAVYTINQNQYTCSVGQYLPANTTECTSCPTNSSCPGGTYTFNKTADNGIQCNSGYSYVATSGNVLAHCLLATYVCNPGYYLPADAEGCIVCPMNSYCVGGAFQYNETTDQGISECPNSWYSPAGMHDLASCGRILHIDDNVVYLRSVKKTTPALHVKVGDDIFYGNMTTTDVSMHSDTERKLKLQYGGQTYSVYDDTVDAGE